MKQNLLPDYAVVSIANKHSARSLSDPKANSIYTEQFVAAIEEALVEAEIRQHVDRRNGSRPIAVCTCGVKGPHQCSLIS